MMRAIRLGAVGITCAVVCGFSGASEENPGGWPSDWPKVLDSLREQSLIVTGSLINRTYIEIPFSDRKQFEAVWPHLLATKSSTAPVVLLNGPHKDFGREMAAGVRVWPPYPRKGGAVPIQGQPNVRTRYLATGLIELIVDASTVDLNRIPLPAEGLVIDLRFHSPK